MVVKFLIIWFAISMLVGWFIYATSTYEKQIIKLVLKAAAVSAVLSLVLITALMFINNLSGI